MKFEWNEWQQNEYQVGMDQFVQSLWWHQPSKQMTNQLFQICFKMSPQSFGLE